MDYRGAQWCDMAYFSRSYRTTAEDAQEDATDVTASKRQNDGKEQVQKGSGEEIFRESMLNNFNLSSAKDLMWVETFPWSWCAKKKA